MKRLSIPIDSQLDKELDARVPHGNKAPLIRGLVRIVLAAPDELIQNIAFNEEAPRVELKEKEA